MRITDESRLYFLFPSNLFFKEIMTNRIQTILLHNDTKKNLQGVWTNVDFAIDHS